MPTRDAGRPEPPSRSRSGTASRCGARAPPRLAGLDDRALRRALSVRVMPRARPQVLQEKSSFSVSNATRV